MLTGARHSQELHNIRFYFNKYTSKIEPIGYDSGIFQSINVPRYNEVLEEKSLQKILFADNEFMYHFIKNLEKFSSNDYLKKLIEIIEVESSYGLKIIHKEWPYYSFDFSPVNDNAKAIKSLLNNDKLVTFNKALGLSSSSFKISNKSKLPIQIKNKSKF